VVSIDGQVRPSSDVIVVPSTFCLPGHAAGSPPLHRLGLTELSRLAQEYGRDWFKNGAVPSVTVESDTPLTAEQAEQIRDRVVSAWRQRRPAVLGSGLRVSTVDSSSSSSSSVTKWSDVSTVVGVQVAQAFGVDPATVGFVGRRVVAHVRESVGREAGRYRPGERGLGGDPGGALRPRSAGAGCAVQHWRVSARVISAPAMRRIRRGSAPGSSGWTKFGHGKTCPQGRHRE
jgi:hypothetical protein